MFKYDTDDENDLNSEFNIDTALNNNWDKIDSKYNELDDGKVDKVEGKSLSSNDFTTTEKNKLANIDNNAQVNTIEAIKVNGVLLEIGTDKSVNIEIQGGETVAIQTARQIITKNTTIANNHEITLPLNYIVGDNSLSLFWNGSKLIMATDTSDGHYKEVGTAGQISNKITMYRTASDGNYTLPEDVILEAVVTEAPTTTVEEGGNGNENT